MQQALTASERAALHGVSVSTVRRWDVRDIRRGYAREVDVERVVGNGARVRVRAVEYVGEGAGL